MLSSLLKSILAAAIVFNTPYALAMKPKQSRLVKIFADAKTMRDLVQKVKPDLSSEEFLFVQQKLKGLENQKPPKFIEIKTDSYELRYGKAVVKYEILSRDTETYSINGKTVELGSLSSSEERYELILNALRPADSASI